MAHPLTYRAARQTQRATPARSKSLLAWLIGSSAVLLPTLLALMLAGVKLGQGYFATLWSPLVDVRLARLPPIILLGAIACGGVWALGQAARSYRMAGRGLMALAMIGAGVWVWWAPPQPMNQQAFNMS